MSEPAKVIAELQKLEPDTIIELFQLDTVKFGGPVYCFHNQRTQGGGTLSFGGDAYQAMSLEATGFAWNGTDQQPVPTITISSLNGVMTALIAEFDNLVGASIRRIRTFRKHLDDGTDPDVNARLSDDVFLVDRKSAEKKADIEWELGSSLDVDGITLPLRKVLARCQANFKDGLTCPYTGTDSTCLKTVDACEDKFGIGKELPYLGFPGIDRINLSV